MVTPPRHPGGAGSSSDPDEPTDAELIARSLDDPRAFMPLVTRHQRVLFGYLARRVGRDIAEDVTSETFTRAFAQRARFDLTRSDARPWLFGIATNLLRNHARSEGRQLRAYARHGVQDRTHDDDAGTDARLDAVAQSPALASALEALKPGDREALLMFAWNDMSYEDIAEALDIPVGTVRSRLNRARRIVQEHLAAAQDPADPISTEARSGRS
jgi:RNA polymerase sigma-70 factor (ECF subfamily)